MPRNNHKRTPPSQQLRFCYGGQARTLCAFVPLCLCALLALSGSAQALTAVNGQYPLEPNGVNNSATVEANGSAYRFQVNLPEINTSYTNPDAQGWVHCTDGYKYKIDSWKLEISSNSWLNITEGYSSLTWGTFTPEAGELGND
ncbi:MAG: hypothetical protein PHT33_13530, partial [bacterium]|nr:hypothetical protein [bacterium]